MRKTTKPDVRPEITKLANEPAVVASIRVKHGTPRLFLNGEETYPLLAWSWGLEQSAPIFRQAGIALLHPILGLNAAWPEPEVYDWSEFDDLFARLLAQHPEAFFLPRVLLDVPQWWKDQNPQELIQCALPTTPEDNRKYRPIRRSSEGGMLWGINMQEPSFASTVWRSDMEKLLRAFLRYIEDSPLRSRIFGYQIGSGIYGEWHYYVAEFMPDVSEPIGKKLGDVPDLEARLQTAFGLFRDPAKEQKVITFYRRFHEEICADTLLHFARIVKEETRGRVLCGAFYGYQLENVWIQEGGHLAPEKVLASPDLDFFASPYSYQTTNIEGRPWWGHDVVDEAGNWLGRARGVAGDGGYRVLLQSLYRHGKLYFAELDAGTYLEPPPINPDGSGGTDVEKELCMVGGVGSNTLAGTQRILRRDLGRMFASGNAAWLFDFGPVLRTGKSWYADQPIIDEVLRFARLGAIRKDLDMRSCAQVAAIYDAKSLFVTRHWRAEAPFAKGGECLDFFTRWFMDSQARSLHRLGAPVDFLYRFDLQSDDPGRYRLFFMVNLFYLTDGEVSRLREILQDSGTAVVWYYAPGFVTPERLDLEQMQRLCGFRFQIITKPGPMSITCQIPNSSKTLQKTFGVKQERYPRFVVSDDTAEPLGFWTDGAGVAFARKQVDGWQSVYVGAAPLPVEILRWLAAEAGVALWSTQSDIVVAAFDTAMVVATADGRRKITLPSPMFRLGAKKASSSHQIDMTTGDVEIFTRIPTED